MYHIELHTRETLAELPLMETLNPGVRVRTTGRGQLTLSCRTWDEACLLVSSAGRSAGVRSIYLTSADAAASQSVG